MKVVLASWPATVLLSAGAMSNNLARFGRRMRRALCTAQSLSWLRIVLEPADSGGVRSSRLAGSCRDYADRVDCSTSQAARVAEANRES